MTTPEQHDRFEIALNPEQRAAALAPDGPVLVLAAAGTGKTRTLVYRVAHLVERGISPERVLLLTFTNRAAREMLERARHVAGPAVSGIWGGTFHHLANRLLRRHAPAVGFQSDFAILDRDDARSVVAQCIKESRLPKDETPKPAVLLSVFSAAANTESDVESVVADKYAEHMAAGAAIVKLHTAYAARKRALRAMDFDDLLVQCLTLLRERKHLLQRYREQFLHVLVDEYQDTNALQSELVDLLASGHRNLLVVGDDFQSIYGWRGADYRNILSFPKRYPDTAMFKLETNYRSVPEILEVANACIAGNPEQFQKTLRPTREPYRKPRVLRLRDGQEQARAMIAEIRHLMRDGYAPGDIAVLYRAHFHAMELQMALTREKLPYVITSGVRFFEQAHIKDVCCFLRLLVRQGDELAFTRILSLLPGVGPRTCIKLWQSLGGRLDPRDAGQCRTVHDGLRGPARRAWSAVTEVCGACETPSDPTQAGRAIAAFFDRVYEAHLVNTFEDFQRRTDDVMELARHLAGFDSTEAFLSDVALATNLEAEQDRLGQAREDAVRLTTVHQAKGLEWPAVLLLWMTEGMFPSGRSLAESPGAEAEERRLFYVAATRARDELVLGVPELRRSRDGGVFYCTPSRFLEEIPRSLLQETRPAPI